MQPLSLVWTKITRRWWFQKISPPMINDQNLNPFHLGRNPTYSGYSGPTFQSSMEIGRTSRALQMKSRSKFQGAWKRIVCWLVVLKLLYLWKSQIYAVYSRDLWVQLDNLSIHEIDSEALFIRISIIRACFPLEWSIVQPLQFNLLIPRITNLKGALDCKNCPG